MCFIFSSIQSFTYIKFCFIFSSVALLVRRQALLMLLLVNLGFYSYCRCVLHSIQLSLCSTSHLIFSPPHRVTTKNGLFVAHVIPPLAGFYIVDVFSPPRSFDASYMLFVHKISSANPLCVSRPPPLLVGCQFCGMPGVVSLLLGCDALLVVPAVCLTRCPPRCFLI